MKKSKKLLSLFTAVIMAVTVFAGAVPANAAPLAIIQVGSGSYGSCKVTGYRSVNSSTQMSGRAKSNAIASRIATTIVVRNENANGDVKATGGDPDISEGNSDDSGTAYITSGSGNHFKWVHIFYAATYNNNLNHTASTEYYHEF